jgi:hypothetical protein
MIDDARNHERETWKHVGYVIRSYGSLKIFGPKIEKVTGSGEYYMTMSFIFCTHGQNIIRWSYIRDGRGGACGQVHAGCWWGRPERKRSLGRSRRRWENNIKMNLKEKGIGRHGLDGASSGQGQAPGSCKCGDGLLCSIKCGEFLD